MWLILDIVFGSTVDTWIMDTTEHKHLLVRLVTHNARLLLLIITFEHLN